MQYLVLISGWAIYFFLHSLLAAEVVKTYTKNKWPGVFRNYRLIYNLIAVLGLMALLLYANSFNSTKVLSEDSWVKYMGLVLAASGTIIIREAFKNYSIREFLGFGNGQTPRKLKPAGYWNISVILYIQAPS